MKRMCRGARDKDCMFLNDSDERVGKHCAYLRKEHECDDCGYNCPVDGLYCPNTVGLGGVDHVCHCVTLDLEYEMRKIIEEEESK